MRSLILVLAAVCVFPTLASADGWEKTADLGLNFNQSSYSDSWTGGEFGTVNWAIVSNLLAEKAFSPKLSWKNDLKLSFGQTHLEVTQENGERKWGAPQKSSDRIFLESLLKFTLQKYLDPYAAVTFESQFIDEASFPGETHWINPALLTESIGAGHAFIKNETTELYSRLGFGVRQRFAYAFATTNDGGLEWVTDLAHKFGEDGDLKVVSKLRLFQAIYSSISDEFKGLPNEDYWKAADVALETTFSAAISKYIQTTLFIEWLYDKEISRQGRFREILGLGVSYKLF